MTDTFRDQDVSQTNIQRLEHEVTLQAKYLFDTAHDPSQSESEFSKYMIRATDTYALWEQKTDKGRVQRILALTVIGNYFIIGVDRRPSIENPVAFRKCLHGMRWLLDSNPRSASFHGTRSEDEIADFYETFFDTVAAFGLYNRLQQVSDDQNESNSAILDSAA